MPYFIKTSINGGLLVVNRLNYICRSSGWLFIWVLLIDDKDLDFKTALSNLVAIRHMWWQEI